MEPIIQTENLCYSYEDGTRALNGVSIAIPKGGRVALLGANGSGKSTFFLCLNGVLKPQEGCIRYNGETVRYAKKQLKQLRKNVGIVFQDPETQLFCANVYEEISFGALNSGMSEEAARKAVRDTMEDLQIAPLQDKPVHALSGGQKKLVSIADILVMRPEVVLLDEPSASLDPFHTDMVYRAVERMSGAGITVVIATHNVDFACAWADTVFVFRQGTILAGGAPKEIFTDSQLTADAAFKLPACIRMHRRLVDSGHLDPNTPVPRSMQELEESL